MLPVKWCGCLKVLYHLRTCVRIWREVNIFSRVCLSKWRGIPFVHLEPLDLFKFVHWGHPTPNMYKLLHLRTSPRTCWQGWSNRLAFDWKNFLLVVILCWRVQVYFTPWNISSSLVFVNGLSTFSGTNNSIVHSRSIFLQDTLMVQKYLHLFEESIELPFLVFKCCLPELTTPRKLHLRFHWISVYLHQEWSYLLKKNSFQDTNLRVLVLEKVERQR